MADRLDAKLLAAGVSAWNQWRQTHPDIRPYLAGANLSNTNLAEADLRYADLREAELVAADLNRANLEGAWLNRAVLRDARLREANLAAANLSRASLFSCDLTGAHLVKTDFSDANLGKATLEGCDLLRAGFHRTDLDETCLDGALFGWSVFADVDLSAAHLRNTRHEGPSTIGLDTLSRTAAGLSSRNVSTDHLEAFLRGCGIEDDAILNLRVGAGRPIAFYSVFISYSHADIVFARRLYRHLQDCRVRCWMDEHELVPGRRILDGIDQGIRQTDKIILCCSCASLNSWWVQLELEKVLERERTSKNDMLVPIDLDGYLKEWESPFASSVRSRKSASFVGWQQPRFPFKKAAAKVSAGIQSRINSISR